MFILRDRGEFGKYGYPRSHLSVKGYEGRKDLWSPCLRRNTDRISGGKMGGKSKSIYVQDDVISDLNQDNFGHKHIADAIVNSIISTKAPFTIGIFNT